MKEPMVITMAREYASGGSEIAQAVADKLGIPLYNKELITLAAKKSGLTEEAIAASENQRSGSLIYSLYMMGNTMPLADQVYILQSNVIKELASQGPCVILGRCGDYVLRGKGDVDQVGCQHQQQAAAHDVQHLRHRVMEPGHQHKNQQIPRRHADSEEA